MECSEVRELLSPMSDREISPDELKMVEEHLRTCKECAFQSTMIVGLKRLLGKWDGVHASGRFRSSVLERIRKEPPPKKAKWAPWAFGGGLAALCAVVLVVAVVLPVAPEGPEDPANNSASSEENEAGSASSRKGDRRVGTRPTRPPGRTETNAASAVPVAQFRTISKAIEMERPDAFPALVTVGDVVAPGSIVRCPEKGAARLELLAGLLMRLEGGAHVVFAQKGHACELRAGRMFLCTKDQAKRPHPYAVRSGPVDVAARDIERALVMSIDRLASGALRLIVAEGEAGVVFTGGERTIARGQMAEFAADGSLVAAPAEAGAEEVGRLRRWGTQ